MNCLPGVALRHIAAIEQDVAGFAQRVADGGEGFAVIDEIAGIEHAMPPRMSSPLLPCEKRWMAETSELAPQGIGHLPEAIAGRIEEDRLRPPRSTRRAGSPSRQWKYR